MIIEPHKQDCGVCGDPIILTLERIRPIEIIGLKKVFFIHKRCRPALMDAQKKKNWKLLPDGPIKQSYFEELKKRGLKT